MKVAFLYNMIVNSFQEFINSFRAIIDSTNVYAPWRFHHFDGFDNLLEDVCNDAIFFAMIQMLFKFK
jgi:hypothetical protein